MNILIASDSFKGSKSAVDICNLAAIGVKKALPDANIVTLPMADGGEGTVETLVINTHGKYRRCLVKGPYGTEVYAKYGILGDKETAIIEMASASGLPLADVENLNPLVASSFGTGQLIKDAIEQGCSKIILGIGGSATNDCGTGMLQALGVRFFDCNQELVDGCGKNLKDIEEINMENVSHEILEVEYLVACDVNNPLIGKNGATMVYGPQKGASKEELVILESGMKHFGGLMEHAFHKEIISVPGSGAAGGMGAALYAFFSAKLESGFKIISEELSVRNLIESNDIDIIFTGEGKIDDQTLNGKLLSGMVHLGKEYEVPVVAIVGCIGTGYEALYEQGLTSVFSIINCPMTRDAAYSMSDYLIEKTYYNVSKLIEF